MAKTATKTDVKGGASAKTPASEDKKPSVPATIDKTRTQVPDHLRERLAASQGRGVSTSREDTIIPMAFVFQKSHSQVDERSDDYVEGAKPGEIWLKGSVTPVRDGEKGELFQPCAFLKAWIEWKPARGGFVNRHKDRPSDAREVEIKDDQGRPKIVWQRPNGNILVETREHYGFFGDEPYMIPMSSTQHTVSRNWMALMGQFKGGDGRPLDSFAKVYLITTARREKEGNNWYVFKADDAGWATAEQYDRGAVFHDAIMSGEKKAADYEDGGPVDDAGDPGADENQANI